jgi:hypothetical protein
LVDIDYVQESGRPLNQNATIRQNWRGDRDVFSGVLTDEAHRCPLVLKVLAGELAYIRFNPSVETMSTLGLT